MTLAAWEAQLHDHFAKLRRQRSTDKPVFGLEHGLDPSGLDELKGAIRAHIAQSSPSPEYPLPWVVYASEFGYLYGGDEYWQTFEAQTPGWDSHGDRHWIRQCFHLFRERYGGVCPSGPWAEQFSIICWPITNAILPKDLQRQLARVLYDLRGSFRGEFFESPGLLGMRIAGASLNATSRFRNFVQEPLLAGQIAADLLFHGEQFATTLIWPATLARIAADLDRERRARRWMQDAKQAAQRVQLRGLREEGAPGGRHAEREQRREQVRAMAIEPRLVLRPSAPTSWDVVLEIPDLTPLLMRFPQMRPFLMESRCAVAGAASRSPLARGRVLYGFQRVVLSNWPRPTEVLLQFEQSSPELDYLLSTECLLRPGPLWLFRIQSEGFAYEVRGKVVRPSLSYILLSTDGPIDPGSFGRSINVACEGAHGVRLDLPEAISADWQVAIERLGLHQSRGVRVWPAGLPASDWDGEGRGEWPFPDQPRIAVQVDHAVDRILVGLEGNEERPLDLGDGGIGEPRFVELPPLNPGTYTLHVSVDSGGFASEEEAGQLDIVIREPRSWTPGAGTQSPFQVIVDPPVPTLEQLWDGTADVGIYGPAGHSVGCTLSLFGRRSESASVRRMPPPMQLPVNASAWRQYFEDHFRDNRSVQNAYDFAAVCQIDFDAAELGKCSVRCEREFTPVRWIVRLNQAQYTLMLLDDSGGDSPVETSRYAFESPDVPVPVKNALGSPGIRVPEAGGMYVARVGQQRQAVVLPPTVRTFADLRIDQQIRYGIRSPNALEVVLDVIELWAGARAPGNIAALFLQRKVVMELLRHVFAVACGKGWEQAEQLAQSGEAGSWLPQLAQRISAPPSRFLGRYEQKLGVALNAEYARLADVEVSQRIDRLWQLAANYLVLPKPPDALRGEPEEHGRWLTEFGLRLASAPQSVRSWSTTNFKAGAEWLLNTPTLARAARFFVLAVDAHLGTRPLYRKELYNGWKWD